MRLRKSFFIPVLFFACVQTAPAAACQCLTIEADSKTPKASKAELRRLLKEVERTSEFFVGTVVAAEHLNIPKPGEFSDELYLVATIEVEELWYGDHSWRKEVYTSAFPTACGVIFKVGEKFIVESELIGETELKTSELPKAASWTDSCQTKPFSPEVYQEKTEWLKDFASPWKPHAKRISLEF